MNRRVVFDPRVTAIGWICLFVAIVGHLPALASWFAQDDWDFLARAAGTAPTPDWPVRPFTTVVTWKVLYTVFGLSAAPHHAVALLLLGLNAALTVRIGWRLGLTAAGAALAGLVVAVTPTAILPIAWASAASELWAAFFALLAVDLWIQPRRGDVLPFLAAVAAGLSLASKEAGIFLPAALWLTLRGWPQPEDEKIRRGRRFLLAALALAALVAAVRVGIHFSQGPLGAYGMGGPAEVGRNFLLFGSWIPGPPRFPGPDSVAALALGGVVWLAWGAAALHRWRQGAPLVAFSLLWGVGSILPVVLLDSHLEPYYMVLAVSGLGWAIGDLVGPHLARATEGLRRPGALLVVSAIVLTLGAWWTTRSTMTERLEDGRLAQPILRRASVAADVFRLLQRVPDLESRPQVAILQATRVEVPEDLPVPEEGEVIVTSSVYTALRGPKGLRLLLPEGTTGGWVTHLDDVALDALVLLDAGGSRLLVLGPVENARLYSALIAVSAGQFARARHDLWSVLDDLGHEVRFAFDPQNLPVLPHELDAEVRGFVRYLEQDPSPSTRRIIKLFAQLYEAVRGQPLFDESWGQPERAPRFGG